MHDYYENSVRTGFSFTPFVVQHIRERGVEIHEKNKTKRETKSGICDGGEGARVWRRVKYARAVLILLGNQ